MRDAATLNLLPRSLATSVEFGLNTSVLDCAPHRCLDEAGQAFTLVEYAFCGGAEFGLDANWRKGRRLHFQSIALAMHVCIIKVPCQDGSDGQTPSAGTLIRIMRREIHLSISGPLRDRLVGSWMRSRVGSRPRSEGTR